MFLLFNWLDQERGAAICILKSFILDKNVKAHLHHLLYIIRAQTSRNLQLFLRDEKSWQRQQISLQKVS